MVWRWPLNNSGLRWHGGVDSSQIKSKSVDVPSFFMRVRGFGEWVKVVLAWPSHSMSRFFVRPSNDFFECLSFSDSVVEASKQMRLWRRDEK